MFGAQKEGSRDALFSHAQTFMISKEYTKALEVYLAITKKYPNEVLAYKAMLDLLCKEFNDYSRAEKEFRCALRGVSDKKVQQKLFAVYNSVTRKKEVELVEIVQ